MNIKIVVVVALLAALVYNRWPTVLQDPSVRSCGKTILFRSDDASDFLPGICRYVLVKHQDQMLSSAYDCGSDEPDLQTIIMLHGFPDNAKTFRKQIEFFTNENYRVIIPVLRGYDSTSLVGNYHITELAQDVLCIAHQLGVEKFHLIGHDWGAIVGHVLGITNSEKLHSLVSVSVPPQMTRAGGAVAIKYPKQLLNSWYTFLFQVPFIPEYVLGHHRLLEYLYSTWSPNYDWSKDAHFKEVKQTFASPGVISSAIAYYRQNVPYFFVESIVHILQGKSDYTADHPFRGVIKSFTLLITGKDDGCISTEVYELPTEKYFARNNLVHVSRLNGGHFVHYENPQEFNKVVLEYFKNVAFLKGEGTATAAP